MKIYDLCVIQETEPTILQADLKLLTLSSSSPPPPFIYFYYGGDVVRLVFAISNAPNIRGIAELTIIPLGVSVLY